MAGVTALFVFDLDGTLLPGSTASLELASALGAGDEPRLVTAPRCVAFGDSESGAPIRV